MRLFFIIILLLTNTSYAFEEVKCVSQVQKTCIDESTKVIEGYRVKKCWKYKEVLRCTSNETNNCSTFEENRGCNEVEGRCLKESPTGLCNHFDKKYICGNTTIESKEVKLINSEFNVIRDEKDFEKCDPHSKDKYCEITSEECVEPSETRNINGKDVFKECWRYNRKYQCRTDTKVNECKALVEKGCKEITRDCIHNEENRCEHYVVEYECENKKTDKIDCIASQFCAGGICDEQERNVNTNFGLAASYLSVLNQVNKDSSECTCNSETDPNCSARNVQDDKCKLFNGESKVCRKYTSQLNCCSDKGLLRSLAGCNEEEKELASKQFAGACHYVDYKNGKGLKAYQKRKAFCCFNSKLARIIQVQGRQQLGRGWGSFDNPDCNALTLQEIKQIDFSQLDFSELYEELKDKAASDFGASNKVIQDKLKSYQDNPESLAGMVKNKMQRFYEK